MKHSAIAIAMSLGVLALTLISSLGSASELDGTYDCASGVRVVKGACENVDGQTYLAMSAPTQYKGMILLYVWSFNWNEQAIGSTCTKRSYETAGVDSVRCAALVKRARKGNFGPDNLNSAYP